MSGADILPWHTGHWDRLDKQINAGRLPHALLFAGPAMSGKSQLTHALTSRLLCSEAVAPCGTCHQCQLVAAGTHPDLLHITLEDSKQIVIDQIRGLIHWANQTSQQGGMKVCVIQPADKLNVQSANALLKCLEEPPSSTCIILVTDQPGKLLPTLRSRCQRIECHLPERGEALAWLNTRNKSNVSSELLLDIAGGVPLRAAESITEEYLALRQQLAGDLMLIFTGTGSPVQLAGGLAKVNPVEVLDILYQLVADTIGFSMSGGQVCINSDLKEDISAFADKITLEKRFLLLERIGRAKTILAGTSNANPQMLFEWLFMEAA